MPTIENSFKKTLTFVHKSEADAEVKTEIVKMLAARFGGRVTVKQKLIDGNGNGNLWIGSSRLHNPDSANINTILEATNWTTDSTILLDQNLVNYPFLIISANFIDTTTATIEVEVEVSWSLVRGR